MKIFDASSRGEVTWNTFVAEHYPPIGAFMCTWEWGVFQAKLNRIVERFFVEDNGELIAAFYVVYHSLPFGFSYGYVPRGPVVARVRQDFKNTREILQAIESWAREKHANLLFLRLEPPLTAEVDEVRGAGFFVPPYYIQPRYNTAIDLGRSEEDILASFHSSTRSNIHRAEKRGVTFSMKHVMTESDYTEFFNMMKETENRNNGKNVYPSQGYLKQIVKAIPIAGTERKRESLSFGIFFGYQNGVSAAAEFVLYFGDTATYLYGAANTKNLSSKVTTYLHWMAMKEARRLGMRYYDLGGIDESRWATLTEFKRQFRGTEFAYIGNIDILLRPALYKLYNASRRIIRSQ